MIQVPMTAASLAASRFAVSRMSETVDGLRALADPTHAAHLQRWLRWVRPRLRGLDLSLLDALVRTGGYVPDFLTPPPVGADRPFADDLDDLLATPADRVRAEIELAHRGRPLPVRLNMALADGEEALLEQVAVALRQFWRVAMQPCWPAIGTALDDDIAFRSRVLARHGAATALSQLDRGLQWDDGCLRIASPDISETLEADWVDAGVVFSPSLFGGPRLYLLLQPLVQTVVYYPVRNMIHGVQPGRDSGRDGQAELIGHTRARILTLLERPQTTADLAARLGLSPSTVSYHLGVLYRAGLLQRRRNRRRVVYTRV